MSVVLLALRIGLAGVFALAAAAKLADLTATRAALREFGVPVRLVSVAAWTLPLVELALAALLIPTATARAAAIGLAVLLVGFSVALARAPEAECNCFGALGGPRRGRRALIRNGALAAAAVLVAVAGPGEGLTELGTGEALVLAALLLAAAAAWVGWAVARGASAAGDEPEPDGAPRSPSAPEGLPRVPDIGTAAPRFGLIDRDGAFVTLDDLLVEGLPVVLAFSDPSCAGCASLPARLDRLRAQQAGRLELALITRAPDGGGFAPALLQQEHEVARLYGAGHVPSALLIDPDGRVASPLAVGDQAIERLVSSLDLEVVG
jgi:uncharacterized membrane protein YphA (DoxX/SURF4 family)/cytochrome oxidase Cu insertion factor (SCO1/SenC/PrrC family)